MVSSLGVIFLRKLTCENTVASSAGMNQGYPGLEQPCGRDVVGQQGMGRPPLPIIQGICLLPVSMVSVDKCLHTSETERHLQLT